jgi:hypothetical protein
MSILFCRSHCPQGKYLGRPGLVLAAAAVVSWASADADPAADAVLIPAEARGVLSIRLADLWSGDLVRAGWEKIPKDRDKLAANIEQDVGVRPEQVERLTIVLAGPDSSSGEFVIVTLNQPLPMDKVGALAGPEATQEKYKGRTLFKGIRDEAVALLSERTFVRGKLQTLRGLLDRPAAQPEGPMAPVGRLLQTKHVIVGGLNVPELAKATANKLPPQVEPLKPLLQAKIATLTVDLGPESRIEAVLTFPDSDSAKKGVAALKAGVGLARAGIAFGKIRATKEPALLGLLNLADSALKDAVVEQSDSTLTGVVKAKTDPATFVPSVMTVVQRQRLAAARVQTQNNLRQIALAMLNFHDTYGHFPAAATYDKAGKPLLSWRVQILPFLEQQELYKQFHLDEPWDSEHNKKLLDKLPRVYATPAEEPSDRTHVQGFVGKDAFFEGKQGVRLADIRDGTSNTIMLVEAANAVPWTKPEDLAYDPAKPLPKLAELFEPGFVHLVLCDGSVRWGKLPKPQTLHLLIQRNDGQPIPKDF